MEFNEEEFLLLSGIQHYCFCKRQWALIHIEQQWSENYQTTAGMIMHSRVHDETIVEHRKGMFVVRGLRIKSYSYGVTGQCDVVEFHRDEEGIELPNQEGRWRVIPVEYKRGSPKAGNEDIVQLCLQGMCLEEMFCTDIKEGYLYYGENRRRTSVEFSLELREVVKHSLDEMHQMYNRGYTPKVKTSKQCKSCSLEKICLPKLQKQVSVREYIRKKICEGGEDNEKTS